METHSELADTAGIALDIDQLYASTKKEFSTELKKIPLNSIKGFHIHYHRRVFAVKNEIPWAEVFQMIKGITKDIFIKPVILHKNKVTDVIEFCRKMLLN
jgi:hypothetical protein